MYIYQEPENLFCSLIIFNFLSPSYNSFHCHQMFGQFLMTRHCTNKVWIKGRKKNGYFSHSSHRPCLCRPAMLERMFWSLQSWGELLSFRPSGLLLEWRRKRNQHLDSVHHQPGCNMAHHWILSSRLGYHCLQPSLEAQRGYITFLRLSHHWEVSIPQLQRRPSGFWRKFFAFKEIVGCLASWTPTKLDWLPFWGGVLVRILQRKRTGCCIYLERERFILRKCLMWSW